MSNTIDYNVAFNFVPRAFRPAKPRSFGVTEVRAPYYSTFGTRHLPGAVRRGALARGSGSIVLPG